MAYRRFRHIGVDKGKMDFAFFAIAFNIKKMVAKMTKGGLFSYLRAYLTHITPYKLFIRLFFVEKQKLVVHPHKNVQRVFLFILGVLTRPLYGLKIAKRPARAKALIIKAFALAGRIGICDTFTRCCPGLWAYAPSGRTAVTFAHPPMPTLAVNQVFE